LFLPLQANWRFLDNDTDPGATWFNPAFDDSSWRLGPGVFDARRAANGAAGVNCRDTALYGLGAVGTCINLNSATTTNTINTFFRTHFNYWANPSGAYLRLSGKMDDSAVIFLNGAELTRAGLPAAPAVVSKGVFGAAQGGRTVQDSEAQDVVELAVPTLAPGDNVLAVMLIQNTPGSPDLTMGLELDAYLTTIAPKLAVLGPDLFATYTLSYTGILQENSQLQSAGWTDVSTNFDFLGYYYVTPITNGATKFYRSVFR